MKYPIEYFELTTSFALKVKQIKNISLDETLTHYTDIRRRFNVPGELSVNNPVVRDFLDNHLDTTNIPKSIRDYHILRKKIAPKKKLHKKYFGVFTYDYNNKTKVVQLHTSVDPVKPGDTSAFSIQHYKQTKEDIEQMFKFIKLKHPDAEKVFIYSWIINIDAFKRLFFGGFGEDSTDVFWNFTGQSIWGQFLNKHQELKKDKVDKFLKCINTKDSFNGLLGCFENKPLRCTYSIQLFYKHFNVN